MPGCVWTHRMALAAKGEGKMLAMKQTLMAAVVTAAIAAPAFAVPAVTLDLQNPQLAGTNATVEVHVSFTSDNPVDALDGIQLSVLASDAALQSPDYSRFSFASASGWITVFDFSDLNFGVAVVSPETFPGPGDGSNFLLGTLSIDLAGLPTGQSYLVDISGGVFEPDRTSTYGAVTAYDGDSVVTEIPGSFVTSSVSFDLPRNDGNAIPEPATAGLGVLALAGLATATMRRGRN